VKWAGRHDDEVTVFELAEDGLDQQLGQATAGSGEKDRRGLQARPGASRQRETAEGELQGDPVSFGLCCRAEYPQAEPFAICDDCIEPVQVLNVLEKDPFAERPLQVRGVRQSSSRGEVTCRRTAAVPDLRLEPRLAIGKPSGVRSFERGGLQTSDRVPQGG
jgi:hypothetical protein